MQKEQITTKQAICILIIYIMGSTMILGIGGEAKNNAWIAGVFGIILAIPIMLVYGKLNSMYPEKDLFEILEAVAGSILGKALAIIYIWYSFHLGALVIRNFGEFINTITMPETPIIVPMLFLGVVCVAAVKSGIEVLGRISSYALPVLLFIIFFVQMLGIPVLKFQNLKPVLGDGIAPVLKGAFSAFAFPFAETILIIGINFALNNRKSIYKVYLTGLLSAGTLICLLTIRNIAVLGNYLEMVYFPSHVAVSRIRIGNFIERVEVTVSIIFVVGVFIKACVCMFVASKGVTKLFKLKDYRVIVIQIGLLMTYFAYIIYDNTMEMRDWAFKVYAYYAFPFQVVIPILLLITAKIRNSRIQKKC